jgi:GTPase SAR1 family protein
VTSSNVLTRYATVGDYVSWNWDNSPHEVHTVSNTACPLSPTGVIVPASANYNCNGFLQTFASADVGKTLLMGSITTGDCAKGYIVKVEVLSGSTIQWKDSFSSSGTVGQKLVPALVAGQSLVFNMGSLQDTDLNVYKLDPGRTDCKGPPATINPILSVKYNVPSRSTGDDYILNGRYIITAADVAAGGVYFKSQASSNDCTNGWVVKIIVSCKSLT